jgi:hypothetical protein
MKKISVQLLSILIIAGALPSCFIGDCCKMIDTAVSIRYVDQQDQNWLTQQSLTEKDLTVYFVRNGQAEKIYRGHLDAPKMCQVIESASGEKELYLFPSDYLDNNYSLTLLEFPDGKVDTVRCYITTRRGDQICKQVWYNGELKWQQGQDGRRIEIVK